MSAGTLEEAKTNTDPTKRKCIQVAFDCRIMPNFIERNTPHDLSDSWVEYAVDLLGLDKIITSPTEATSFEKEKADTLLRKLEGRYRSHIKTRINDTSKRNHWVLTLAYKNLPVVAACMILSQHLAMDISVLATCHLYWPHTQTHSYLVLTLVR